MRNKSRSGARDPGSQSGYQKLVEENEELRTENKQLVTKLARVQSYLKAEREAHKAEKEAHKQARDAMTKLAKVRRSIQYKSKIHHILKRFFQW